MSDQIENLTEIERKQFILMQKSLDSLREMTKIQCSDGNWNFDHNMHGMANGMIFALSLFDDKESEYLPIPEQYLKDLNRKEILTKEDISN